MWRMLNMVSGWPRGVVQKQPGRDGVQENLRRRLDMSGRFNVAPMATRSPSFPVQHKFNAQILPTVGQRRALSQISKPTCVSSVLECLTEQYSTTVHSGLGLGGPVSPNSSIPRTILPRFRETQLSSSSSVEMANSTIYQLGSARQHKTQKFLYH